jgi:hypothetical protein
MQYLRARYYNPASGTFNRLDPFAGNMQDPQSLHKYLYVHGDPIQGVDPTGLSYGVAKIGAITAIIGSLAWLGVYSAFRRPGNVDNAPYFISQSQKPNAWEVEGSWNGWAYVSTILGYVPDHSEVWHVGHGCIGLAQFRLGLKGNSGLEIWNHIDGVRVFMVADPQNLCEYGTALSEAYDAYDQFKAEGGHPWIVAYEARSSLYQITPANTLSNSTTEVDLNTIPGPSEVTKYNYASRLHLPNGGETWESAQYGSTSLWKTTFIRHLSLDHVGDQQIYFIVSPTRRDGMVDVVE